jgi:hypothetical protein
MLKKMLLLIIVTFSMDISATELTFNYNSPSFSGIGYSSHVLTLNQLETQATEKNRAAAEALQAKAEAAAQNAPQAKFLANLESRIYSQLAKQLTDSMFAEGATCTTPGVICGTIPDLGGNTVSWKLGDGSDTGLIILTIMNNTSNQSTTMKVPAGTFYF